MKMNKEPLLLLSLLATPVASSWVDPATPADARSTIGMKDNRALQLVFSDEFEQEGRNFGDGSDTRWTAEDRSAATNAALHYYNSSRVTTRSGKLIIETTNQDASYEEHDKDGNPYYFTRNYQSGMVTSWNKFCFTSGLVEMAFQLPGKPNRGGLWPAFWVSSPQIM